MSLNENEWLTEVFENRTGFSVRYSRKLFDETSRFQRIEVFDTEVMGRVLLLDGCFMVTQRDAFIYHEMLVHPAMQVLPKPRSVLVIGGGDGGAVTEVAKYPFVDSITLCEIDPLVVSACRALFPEISSGLADERVKVLFEDGAAFIKKCCKEFDLVIVDSTDPVGPAKALFETSFYESVKRALADGGVAVFQTESPLFMEDVFSTAVRDLCSVFGSSSVHPYLATIPCYPGALWSFTFCSETHDPVQEAPAHSIALLTDDLRYYNPQVHRAAFALPVFVKKAIEL
jgi:spermidine synthase